MFEVAKLLLYHYVTLNTNKEMNQWNVFETIIIGWNPSGYIKDRKRNETIGLISQISCSNNPFISSKRRN